MGLQKNHWVLKDSELQQLLRDYSLAVEDSTYNRKEAIAQIIEFEQKIENGEIVEEGKTGDVMEQLKKEIPKLRLTRVIFHNTMENDMPYIFVGHNGRGFYIPKEQELDVPDYILNSCIKDAVEERLIPVSEMNGDIRWTKKRIQRFPYSIVKPSFEAE